MNPVLLFLTVMRERFAAEAIPRQPEPEVMVEPEQVRAYAAVATRDPIMSASYSYQAASITRTLWGAETVLDLGCGPGLQLAEIAQLNPASDLCGVDLSEAMLELARQEIVQRRLPNVRFEQTDITKLETFADDSFDAVISSMALHQLPSLEAVSNCLAQAARVLKPGGAVHLFDFGRPKRLRSMLDFAYRLGWNSTTIFADELAVYKRFKDDYFNSLWAAFTPEELKKVCRLRLPAACRFITSAPIPMLCVVKTPARTVPDTVLSQIRRVRSGLTKPIRGELDGIRRFLQMGGVEDPFR